MSKDLTLALVTLIRDHGSPAVQDAFDTAESVCVLIDHAIKEHDVYKKKEYVPRPRRQRRKRKTLTARELASVGDWTATIGEFFVHAEKNGSTEVPMRDVVNYIVANSERSSVTGSAYRRYIAAVESIGWARSFTGKNGVKARTFVKVG